MRVREIHRDVIGGKEKERGRKWGVNCNWYNYSK